MKRLLLLLCILPLFTVAQKKEQVQIDSLLQDLSALQDDTNKVNTLSRLSFAYQTIDPALGIQRGEEGLALAEKLGWEKGKAISLNSAGLNYKARADYPKALESFFNALKINEAIPDKRGTAQNCGNIAIVYKAQGDFGNALNYYQRAVDLFEEIKDKKGVAINLGNMGILYNTQKQFAKALDHELRALSFWKESGNKKSTAIWLGNIAIVYGDSGEYAKALDYARQALAINEAIGNKKGIADNYRSLGAFYYGIAKETSASLVEKTSASALAKENLSKALGIATELGDLRNLQEINDILAKTHELTGAYDEALKHYRQYVMYKDSIFSMESKKMIANLESKREAELNKKELELEKAESRRATIYFIAGIAVLLIISALLFSRTRLKQRSNVKLQKALNDLKETQAQLIQQEKLASLGQMTAGIAHEIQNPLNFVINFSSLSRDLAEELNATSDPQELTQLKNMLRDNLAKIEHHGARLDQIVKGMLMHSRSGGGTRVPTDINALCEEMISLSKHSSKLEYPDLEYVVERSFSPELPALSIVPQDISRVLLNLLNNAVYAVRDKKDAKITVTTKRSGDTVIIYVKDNGAGIPNANRERIFQPFFTTKPSGSGTGLGLSISFDIVKAHGGELRAGSVGDAGAEFVVVLPVKSNG